jgi:hypothetical protein
VRLFQLDTSVPAPFPPVQLMDTIVGQTGTPNATQYSFCVPPSNGNEYTVQRFEQAGPGATPVPVGTQQPVVVATPPPAPMVSPSPGATPTPCPLCENAAGQCPGNCLSTEAIPLQ